MKKWMNFVMLGSLFFNLAAPVTAVAVSKTAASEPGAVAESATEVIDTAESSGDNAQTLQSSEQAESSPAAEPTGRETAASSETAANTVTLSENSLLTWADADKQELYKLNLAGTLTIEDPQQQGFEVILPTAWQPEAEKDETEQVVISSKQQIGSFEISHNEQNQQVLQLTLTAPQKGQVPFEVTLYGGLTTTAQALVFTDEEQELLTIPTAQIPQMTADSDSSTVGASSTEAATETTASSAAAEQAEAAADDPAADRITAAERAAVSVSDLFDQYAPGQNFVTDMVTTFDPEPVTIDSAVTFALSFAIPDAVRAQLQPGDFYEMKLPEGLKLTAEQTGELRDGQQKYGEYVLEPATNMLKITFTNNDDGEFTPASGGGINYQAVFDQQIIQTPGKKTFYYPVTTNLPPFEVLIKPKTGSSIAKAGHSDREINPSTVTWTVDFNKDLSTLTNGKITEHFPAQVSYDSSQPPVIYPLQLDLNGQVTGVGTQALDTGLYTVASDGSITFKQPIEEAYRIVYTTPIKDSAKPADGGAVTATNSATLSADGLADISASASVTFNYGKTLNKTNDKYDAATQTYTWTIHYNYGQKNIPLDQPITDSFDNLTLLADSFQINYVNFTTDGKTVKGAVVPATAYTLTTNTSGQFELQFNDQVQQNQGIDITYQTKVSSVVTDNSSTTIKNDVGVNGITNPPTITQHPRQQAVIKNKPTVNYGTKVAHWTIDINKNHYSLENAQFTDTMDYTNEGYVSFPAKTGSPAGSEDIGINIVNTDTKETLTGYVKFTDVAGNVLETLGDMTNADYILEVTAVASGLPSVTYKALKIQFVNAYQTTQNAFRVDYYTGYNQFNTPPSTNQLTYNNRMDMSWSEQGKDYTSTSSNGFKTSTNEAHQGVKSGSYDPLTKEITWTILANYNGSGISQFNFSDPITGNQVYIDQNALGQDALKITRGTLNAAGNFVETTNPLYSGNQVGASYLQIQKPNQNGHGNSLDISFGQSGNFIPGYDQTGTPLVFKIEFKTSLAGQIVNAAATYQNTAMIDIAGVTQELPASVAVNYAGETANKQAQYDSQTGLINWSLWLNRSQSALNKAVLTDYPSSNQAVLEDSIQVYQGVVAANGTVTKGDLLDPNTYTVLLQTDNTTGQQTLQVSLDKVQENSQKPAGVIEKPYLVTYQTRPNFSSQAEVVSNTAQVTSEGGSYEGTPTTSSQTVRLESSSGNAWGEKGSLTIQKVDSSSGSVLAGAKLQLVRHYESGRLADQVLYTATTDANGQASFGNLIYSDANDSRRAFTYLIKEVSAPIGYTISDELLSGIPVSVNAVTTQGVVTKIENQPVQVTFKKVDLSGMVLSGGLFALFVRSGDEYIAAGAPFTATAAGVTLSNLSEGDYQIREITAPAGYLLNPTPLAFSVKLKDNQQRGIFVTKAGVESESTGVLELIDYQGSATLTKTDASGNGLAGAVFELLRADYQSSDYQTVVAGITSNDSGQITLANLSPGNYLLRETQAPAGYYLNPTAINFSILYQSAVEPAVIDLTAEQAFVNYQGSASFKKTTADGTTGLTGAVFELLDENNQPVEKDGTPVRVSSGAGGEIMVHGLAAGTTYGLREITAPQGYIVNDTILRFVMPLSGPASQGVTLASAKEAAEPIYQETTPFRNYQGVVQFTKVGPSKTGDQEVPLAGAKFKLFKVADDRIAEQITSQENGADAAGNFVSGSSGVVQAGDLEPGHYIFIESQAPEGYIGQTPETNIPLAQQQLYFTVTADNLGEPTNIDLGEAVNYLGAAVFQKTDENDLPLAGAQFTLEKKNAQGIYEDTGDVFESDKVGQVLVDKLGPGDYRVVESQAPDGYYLNPTALEFSIPETASSRPAPIDLQQTLINYQGNAVFKKTAGNGTTMLAGAEFILLDEDEQEIMVAGQRVIYRSNEQGVFTIENLAAGQTYGLQEITAPDGYILNDGIFSFTMPASGTAEGQKSIEDPAQKLVYQAAETVKNYQGVVKFTKVGQPKLSDDQKQVSLAGAQYGLYKVVAGQPGAQITAAENGANEAGLFVSDAAGHVQAGDLAPGDYQFVEKIAPAGYLINPTPITFTIEAHADGPVVVDDPEAAVNYQGAAQLVKKNEAGDLLAGAVFAVYKKGSGQTPDQLVASVATDQQGIALAEGLAPGEYYFQETRSPADQYIVNTEKIPFVIADSFEGKPTAVAAKSADDPVINYLGTARLQKVTENEQALAGAVFKVVAENGEVAAGNEALVSDENGFVSASRLAPGRYSFVETKAPAGYLLNDTPVPFEIEETAEGKPQTVVSYQEQLLQLSNYQGTAQLKKIDVQGQPIAGAHFKLVTTAGQSVRGHEELVSNQAGFVIAKDLAPGTYRFVETQAAAGYLLNTAELPSFTVSQSATGEPKIVINGTDDKALVAVNYQGSAQLKKVDAAGQPVAGAHFKLIDGAGQTVADQEELISGKDGSVLAQGLAPGTYRFVETRAAAGYLLNTAELPSFEITEAAAGEPSVVVSGADGKALTAVNYQGSAQLLKMQANGQPLAGAHFKLLDQAGQTVAGQEDLLSNDQGEVAAKDLAPGSYTFVETQAPQGYLLNKTKITFTIAAKAAGEPKQVTTDDQSNQMQLINYQGSVHLTKVDEADHDKKLAQAVFQLLNEEGQVVKDNLTTDAKGELTVEQLAPGSYTFKETQAPAGYQLSKETYTFEIAAMTDGQPEVIELLVENTQQPTPSEPSTPTTPSQPNDGKTNPPTKGSTTSNKGPARLLQTNDTMTYGLTIIGILLLGTVVMILWRRRSNTDK